MWAGHVRDPETGLFYMRCDYDPRTLPDPGCVFGDLGLYTYAGGNPATLLDPLSLNPIAAEGSTSPHPGADAIVRAGQESLDANEGYWDHALIAGQGR